MQRGFCSKNRSAAVVPSARVRKKWCTAVRQVRFLGWLKPAKLVIAQREIAVAPFHICTGALEHLREPSRLSREGMLRRRAQRAQRSIRRKQRSAETLSKRTKRLACCYCPRRGHTVAIAGWNEMGVHGVGLRRRQRQATHLLPHIPRDELDGRLHGGHHTLGFLETIQARLAEVVLLGNRVDRVDVLLDIPRNELAVATHAALHVNKVVGVADGAHAWRDLLALCAEALVLVACCVHLLFDLLQARGSLRGTARATLGQLVVSPVEVLVHPRARLFRLGDRLVGRPLFNGHRSGDGLAQCMLPMEEVRRVMLSFDS
jgi:hypothetical protein